MITLSNRLQKIADEIEKGETMADIGTDHGFLPLFLVGQGICPKAVLSDISKGSLAKAEENAAEGGYAGSKALFFRLGDGISILENGEADAVVIAGMGGILMTEILSKNEKKAKSMGKYLLQPRNHSQKLRYWLLTNGYRITGERLVREGKFICEILIVRPGQASERELSSYTCNGVLEPENPGLWVPRALFAQDGALACELAETKLRIEQEILERMKCSREPNTEKKRRTEERIAYLKQF